MNAPPSRLDDETYALLTRVRNKGVRLWASNGELHFKAPHGALTLDDISVLKEARGRIVALLERAADGLAQPKFEGRSRTDRTPLAFSQLAHWQLYGLRERTSVRQIVSATRLRGRLNVDVLRRSIDVTIVRHDALRTRIAICDGRPVQEVTKSNDLTLEITNLGALPYERRELEVIRLIEKIVLEPIDVLVGPLLEMRLVELSTGEHILIVAMEHMISDACSMGIFLRDVFTTYANALKGVAPSLPAIPIQFPDYAAWQSHSRKSWYAKHGTYWDRYAKVCGRVGFPGALAASTDVQAGWGVAHVEIDATLKAELREWCRLKQTTLVMGIFTAYAAVFLRWAGVTEAMIGYQVDGRTSPNIEDAIGYFSSTLYLHLTLGEDESVSVMLNRVTDEYCRAYEHADSSYIESLEPRPEFTRNTCFNWVSRAAPIDLSPDGSELDIVCSSVPFENPLLKSLCRDTEPYVLLSESEEGIAGGLYFPLNRFSVNTMEEFVGQFMRFIKALLRQPDERVPQLEPP